MILRLLTASALCQLGGACTNFMVAPGAALDGSTMLSYSCDGPSNGALAHDAATNTTYNRIGMVNEHAVAFGETTFDGLEELSGTGKNSYYDLMEGALRKAKTAREAIAVMDELVRTDGGYGSSGESFTIGDQKEVWHMEAMAKGKHDKGWVWVAMRVPDGHIGGHANQARIRTFPLQDPENCLYSKDVIDFAVNIGLYPADAPKEEFSFADAYDPISFSGARICDARVWYFFSKVGPTGFEKQYEDYAKGHNLTNRMPLFIKPVHKVNLTSLFHYMRHHYEGSALDPTKDISAGPHHGSFRPGPNSWKSNGHSYVNERPVGVPYAAIHYTAQLRQGLPKAIAALNWFGTDDSSYSVHVPFHGCTTRVPRAYSREVASIRPISFESSFWINNMVANMVYYRHDQMDVPVLQAVLSAEQAFIKAVAEEDAHAAALWPTNESAAVEYLTNRAEVRANEQVAQWLDFYKTLFVSHVDGRSPKGDQQGYAQDWYDRVAHETGDRYRDVTKDEACEHNERKMRLIEHGSSNRRMVV